MNLIRKKSFQGLMVLVISLCIILVGTFAWYNFTQSALNIFEGMTNPGGNLHDDYKPGENNKDVYVENNGNRPIYVRVRLSEYMDINSTSVIPSAVKNDTNTWYPHSYLGTAVDNCGEEFHDYYTWIMGDPANDPDKGFKYYMPAPFANRARFNADGTMQAPPTAVTYDNNNEAALLTKYGLSKEYNENELQTGDQAYARINALLYATDASGVVSDTALMTDLKAKYQAIDDAENNAARNAAQGALQAFLVDNALGYWDKVYVVDDDGNIVTPGIAGTDYTIEFVPISRTQTTAKVYTMADWIAAGTPTGDFWIIDNTSTNADEGSWAYWGNVLQPGASTGLLLSEVVLSDNNPAGPWYYGINVELQAVTYDDLNRFGLTTAENGGGGITDQGMMVLQASSGDYVFDMQAGFTGSNDPVYTFVNNKDNTFRMMTSDGSGTITYGPLFVYTGTTPPVTTGDVYSGDASYKVGSTFKKNIPFGASDVSFTVVETKSSSGTGVIEGQDGKHYIKLSYTNAAGEANQTVWLATGADKKFDKISANRSDGDDILVWTTSPEPGTGVGDRFVEDASASYKIGDEFTEDSLDWVIIGVDAKEGSTTNGKTLIISKNVLEIIDYGQITTSLEAYKSGAKTLTNLVSKDGDILPKLLTIQESMDFFSNNAARVATDAESEPANKQWWLSDGIVGTNGALNAMDENAAEVGLRVAFWMDSAKLQELLYPTNP